MVGKMPKISAQDKKLAWTASILIAVAIVVFASFSFWGTRTFDEFVFFALMIGIFPPAILNYMEFKWKKSHRRAPARSFQKHSSSSRNRDDASPKP